MGAVAPDERIAVAPSLAVDIVEADPHRVGIPIAEAVRCAPIRLGVARFAGGFVRAGQDLESTLVVLRVNRHQVTALAHAVVLGAGPREVQRVLLEARRNASPVVVGDVAAGRDLVGALGRRDGAIRNLDAVLSCGVLEADGLCSPTSCRAGRHVLVLEQYGSVPEENGLECKVRIGIGRSPAPMVARPHPHPVPLHVKLVPSDHVLPSRFRVMDVVVNLRVGATDRSGQVRPEHGDDSVHAVAFVAAPVVRGRAVAANAARARRGAGVPVARHWLRRAIAQPLCAEAQIPVGRDRDGVLNITKPVEGEADVDMLPPVVVVLVPVGDRCSHGGDVQPVVGVLHVNLADVGGAAAADLVAVRVLTAADAVVVRADRVQLLLIDVRAADEVVHALIAVVRVRIVIPAVLAHEPRLRALHGAGCAVRGGKDLAGLSIIFADLVRSLEDARRLPVHFHGLCARISLRLAGNSQTRLSDVLGLTLPVT